MTGVIMLGFLVVALWGIGLMVSDIRADIRAEALNVLDDLLG